MPTGLIPMGGQGQRLYYDMNVPYNGQHQKYMVEDEKQGPKYINTQAGL